VAALQAQGKRHGCAIACTTFLTTTPSRPKCGPRPRRERKLGPCNNEEIPVSTRWLLCSAPTQGRRHKVSRA
jgi:hypothetical protein